MKHKLKVTVLLIIIFFFSQALGLAVTNEYLDHQTSKDTGNVTYHPGPPGFEERPEMGGGAAVGSIILAIIVGTILLFLLMKIKKFNFFKIWFLLAVGVTLYWSLNSFIPYQIAGVLAVSLALYKIYKPNVFVHNLTEPLVYSGLAAIFVPVLENVLWGIVLLILISLYDMYAVWKSKHMVKLAKIQSKSKVFAGLLIPYERSKRLKKGEKGKKKKVKTAVLGGGDIGFPLIFAGLIMQDLMLKNPEWLGFLKGMIVPVFATIALSFLFFKGKKDRFYPAMPFITAGCFVGYGVLLLINLLV